MVILCKVHNYCSDSGCVSIVVVLVRCALMYKCMHGSHTPAHGYPVHTFTLSCTAEA